MTTMTNEEKELDLEIAMYANLEFPPEMSEADKAAWMDAHGKLPESVKVRFVADSCSEWERLLGDCVSFYRGGVGAINSDYVKQFLKEFLVAQYILRGSLPDVFRMTDPVLQPILEIIRVSPSRSMMDVYYNINTLEVSCRKGNEYKIEECLIRVARENGATALANRAQLLLDIRRLENENRALKVTEKEVYLRCKNMKNDEEQQSPEVNA